MAMASEAIYYEITEQTGYDFLGEVRYGANGDLNEPTYELDAGDPSDVLVGERQVWDGDIDDGVDSGWVAVELYIDADELQWTVGGVTVNDTPAEFGTIQNVKIVAATDSQAGMLWSGLQVSFYDDGQLVDSYYQSSGPFADRTQITEPGALQKVLTITPESSEIDAVRVTAMVKLTCPEGVYLDANSVFGQILITEST